MSDKQNTQAGAESYPPRPEPAAKAFIEDGPDDLYPEVKTETEREVFTIDQLYAYADATAALRASGAVPSDAEIVLTFNWGALVKVEAAGRVLYEVDLSPQPYWQVCWASGWGGEYDTEEQAQQDCQDILGYGRATREVCPGDAEYKNPRTLRLTEKRFPVIAAAPQAPASPTTEQAAAADHNFNLIQYIDHWLLEQGHYVTNHTEQADGAMAPAMNWIATIKAMIAASGGELMEGDGPTVDRMAEVMCAMLDAVTTQEYQDAADDAKELVAQVEAAKSQKGAA